MFFYICTFSTQTLQLHTKSLGMSMDRSRSGSQVSFTNWMDCSSLLILVAIMLSSISRVLIP